MKFRLPSFNDFSRGILNDDLRPVLKIIQENPKLESVIFEKWKSSLFPTWDDKRIQTNIPATLKSTGLTNSRPLELSDFGESVCNASSPQEAAKIFCAGIIEFKNGFKLIEAIRNLESRGDKATKGGLQHELSLLDVELSNDTTDHTTLKNWMIVAGMIAEEERGFPKLKDDEIKRLTGISGKEAGEFQSLPLAQQIFLRLLRRLHITDAGPFDGTVLYSECRTIAPHEFKSANLAKAVFAPLVDSGWITVELPPKKGRGGKSGRISGTQKLLEIPEEKIIPDFDSAIPPDLRPKLQTPLSQIKDWLDSEDINKGGLGLELLVLRIILDLRLNPRGFRLRSKNTAYAEVDVAAEGDHLLFSRWTFQCKKIQQANNVGLGDVAKEVGIAVYMKAHVIVMVSTGGFSSEALAYAREVSQATPLQFLFLNGKVIRDYLENGPAALHNFVMSNATQVMLMKRAQPIDPETNK
jgi:hypothetical protein